MMRRKISLIGAGNVGGTLAIYLAQREIGDIVLLDVAEGIPQGKCLDILQAMPVFGKDIKLVGTQDYAFTKDSDIYIVSAGSPRKPGMSRDDLLKINAEVIKNVGEKIRQYSPNAFVMVITNPLDAMTQLMKEVTGFPKNRVFGMAGVLDSARFRAFLAQEIGVSIEDIHTLVLGGHGDSMVPLSRYCTVSGVPISYFISEDKLQAIMDRVRRAGGEIVRYLKTGSAFYSPAASALVMIEAIFKDKRRLLCCSAYLEGEYGVDGYYMGVPVILGKNGVEKIVELELNEEESENFQKSIEACKSNIETLRKISY